MKKITKAIEVGLMGKRLSCVSLTWHQEDAMCRGRGKDPFWARATPNGLHIIPSWLIASMRREKE